MVVIPIPSKAFLETITHVHPSLGSIKGRLYSKCHFDGTPVTHPVVQFRSIPYATIPARFKTSLLCSNGLPEKFDERPKGDFTNYGYACPQIPQPRDAECGYLPGEEIRRYNEDSCLNLTVAAPVQHLPKDGDEKSSKLLPVMVYIHGGAFSEGAGHVSTVHETVKMAELATRDNMGIVAVNVGYRLNYFGFLACQDLLDDREGNEAVFNQGLRDQRNAFLWIKKYIKGFGGDPENITVFGESAGSVSIALQLCSDAPIFNRAVMQSGNSATIFNTKFSDHEARYQQLLEYLSIKGETAVERLAALRAVPADRLINAVRDLVESTFGHCADDADFFPKGVSYSKQGDIMANCSWVDSIIIGDTFFEGYAIHALTQLAHPPTFVKVMKKAVGGKSAEDIFKTYDIPSDGDIDGPRFWVQCMELIGDFLFSEPADTLARELAEKTQDKDMTIYRYSFGLPNPFPGSVWSYVHGHHFVDLMFVFMTMTERYPRWRDRFFERQSIEFARRWIRFANGQQPWQPYTTADGHIAICDNIRGWELRTEKEDEEVSKQDPWGPRRYAQWRVIREAWKSVYDAAGAGPEGEKAVDVARTIATTIRSYWEKPDAKAINEIARIHAG